MDGGGGRGGAGSPADVMENLWNLEFDGI